MGVISDIFGKILPQKAKDFIEDVLVSDSTKILIEKGREPVTKTEKRYKNIWTDRPVPSSTPVPTPTSIPTVLAKTIEPVNRAEQRVVPAPIATAVTNDRLSKAKEFIPVAKQREEARAAEEGKSPVSDLARYLVSIYDQETDFATNPNTYRKNTTGDLGPFQINDVYTKPGQGAHGLYIADEDRLDFNKSLQFADDFLSTFFRKAKQRGLSDEDAWKEAIRAWNSGPGYWESIKGNMQKQEEEGIW